MAKVSIHSIRPPKKRKKRVTSQDLLKLFASKEPSDAAKEMRNMNPSKEVMVPLLEMLEGIHADPAVFAHVQKYCQDRGWDPNQPRMATHCATVPETGERRIYNVQYNEKDRPFVRVPLDPLGKPDQILVTYQPAGGVTLELI